MSHNYRGGNRKHVHFADEFTPSALTLRLKLGPRDRPTVVVKITVDFEAGRLPRIRVKTKKPKEKRRRRQW